MGLVVVEDLEIGGWQAVDGVAVAVGDDDVGEDDAGVGVEGECRVGAGGRLSIGLLRRLADEQSEGADEQEAEKRSERSDGHADGTSLTAEVDGSSRFKLQALSGGREGRRSRTRGLRGECEAARDEIRVRRGVARGDVLGAVPVEAFDVDEDGAFDDGVGFGGAELLDEHGGRVVVLVDLGAAEDFEAGLVGVVHEEEGDAVVVVKIAEADVLLVAAEVGEADEVGARTCTKP